MSKCTAVVVVVVFVVLASLLAGCSNVRNEVKPAVAEAAGLVEETLDPGDPDDPVGMLADYQLKPGFAELPYEPVKVTPQVVPYTVKSDLGNVANPDQFNYLPADGEAMLAKNAFFVLPATHRQIYYPYEAAEYGHEPVFITTDSLLHTYHLFFDMTLRQVENTKLYGLADSLTGSMVARSRDVSRYMVSPEWQEAAANARAYFLVPQRLFNTEADLPNNDAGKRAQEDLGRIEEHSGRLQSSVFPYKLDYSQFNPRGHYTRTKRLERYFRAMMWYGLGAFQLEKDEDVPDWPQIRTAVLVTAALFSAKVGDRPAVEVWEDIFEPTGFYVGQANNPTPIDLKRIMDKVYGANPAYRDLQDEERLKQVYAETKKLPKPAIEGPEAALGGPAELQVRFMGQRYVMDTEIMRNLVKWPERRFPMGMDVMAAMGSKRAEQIILDYDPDAKEWPEYLPRLRKQQAKFTNVDPAQWRSNLYWGWMWSINSLLPEYGAGYPSFMRNQAWQDKSLNTALGSWTELRHDTILYAMAVEAGGNGERPPMPKSYVEPNVELYNRLVWLVKSTQVGLQSRDMLDDKMNEPFADFLDLLVFVRGVAVKELTNQKVTTAEHERMLRYGGELEAITLALSNDETINQTDANMAVIADVATSDPDCLEEGVGYANEIFVVVPIEGKLYLTRGGVFSYYEFTHPCSDRLTDEKWQEMLEADKAPPVPAWTKSFMVSGQ